MENLTPEEKANELIEDCYKICSLTMAGAGTIFKQISIKQAINNVDMLLREIDSPFEHPHFVYWSQVMAELKKK